jgi:ubiquinone/menaquinone biosynthesis C-methylase UbiE
MSNGSWENIYIKQGQIQIDVLDSVIDAVKVFQFRKCTNILDLGCGTGRHTMYLSDKGFNLYACDISKKGLDIAKKKLKKEKINGIKFSVQDMYSLKYKNNMFDGVLCIWVQGHGYKDQVQKGIDEIYRTLKPEGVVITDFVTIEDPTYGIGKKVALNTFVGGREGEEDIPHFYSTKNELKEMFSNYSSIDIKDKIYSFQDSKGIEYKIIAVIVTAIK